ncbi:copine-8-like, partial [Saccoglossus kowalevskii]|uniref:Copine-8-like n=1 Tax=Saccoglossus kowalevskii TaxID=10224 RepID=A0ABM0GKX4_SACKO
NLLDMDTFSKSDPMCVMFIQPMGTKNFVEFGRTEVIWDNLNPDFVTKFVLDYFFEERQELKFELYDVDSKSKDLRKHDFLGAATCALGAIVGSNGGRMTLPLSGLAKNAGTIILQCEELSDCRDLVTMQFKGEKLDKKDFFGKSDPFLVFYRCNEDGSYTICHKTEVIKNTLNPNWKPFSIMVRSLCNGDYDRTIKVECYDWNSSGSHEIIGEFTTSLRQLSQGPGAGNHYECVNKVKQKKKKSYKHSGMITLLSCSVEPQHSFLDYIRGGTQLNFTVAIDFTASN